MHLFQRAAVVNEEEVINQIPVIDCAAFFREEEGAEAAFVAAVEQACREVGFFYIKGHGVPQQLIDACFAQTQAFHALPLEPKLALRQDANNIGYMPMNHSITSSDEIHRTKHPNQNASFFVGHDRADDHPDVLAGTPLRGKNQWPAERPEFRTTVMSYFAALQGVAERLVPAFALTLGADRGFFKAAFAGEPYIELRLLHSPPQTDVSDEKFNVAPHTDNSFITLLAREPEERPALAVRLKSGEWFKAPIVEGTFLVNLGNAMRRCSNGEFMSTPHGVINEALRDRYSIAFFYSPQPDAIVAPVPTMVTSAQPARFEPVRYGDMATSVHDKNYGHFRAAAA